MVSSLASVVAATAAVLQPFGTSDFIASDHDSYVVRGDEPAATLRVLDTGERHWRTLAKPVGCAPPIIGRPARSGRLLLQCTRAGPARTFVMFLRTGMRRRLRGGTGLFFSVGRWWAKGESRTYVNLITGRRAQPSRSGPRDLDDAHLAPVRTCPRFRSVEDDRSLTREGPLRAARLRRGRLVLQRCDGRDRELARDGATSVSLSAGIVTWRRGANAFAFDVRTGAKRGFRLPDAPVDDPLTGRRRRVGSVLHTRDMLVWRAVTHYDDGGGEELLPARYTGYRAPLARP